jgi:hypothetical protein
MNQRTEASSAALSDSGERDSEHAMRLLPCMVGAVPPTHARLLLSGESDSGGGPTLASRSDASARILAGL